MTYEQKSNSRVSQEQTTRKDGKLGKYPHLGGTLKMVKELGGFGTPAPTNYALLAMLYDIPRTCDDGAAKDAVSWASNRFHAILYGKGSISEGEAMFLYAAFQRVFKPAANRISLKAFLGAPISKLMDLMNLGAASAFWRGLDPVQALYALAIADTGGAILIPDFEDLRWETEDDEAITFEAYERHNFNLGEEHFLKLTGAPRRSDPPLTMLVGDRPGRVNGAELRAQTLRCARLVRGGWRIGRSALTPLNAPKIPGDFGYVAIAGAVAPLRADFEAPEGEARRLDSARLARLVERLRQEQAVGRVAIAALRFRTQD